MLRSINIGILIVSLAAFAYIGWTVYSQWRVATSEQTGWRGQFDRLLAGARNSAVILWAKVVALFALALGNIDTVTGALGLPEVTTFLNTWIANPKLLSSLLLGVSFVSFRARLRTL